MPCSKARNAAQVMVDANQREAERDMLVQMAQEVSLNLKQMEEALDTFFRDEDDRTALADLPVWRNRRRAH